MSDPSPQPRVVIIGGGFGGLYAARSLRRTAAQITLVDRRNHHLFQPLLYQVATAALNPSDIAYPLRAIFRQQKNTSVVLAEAQAVHLAENRVILDNGELQYDYVIIATGATHSYFGHTDWQTYAPGLKSIEDAVEIRRRIYLAYEAAERESDPEARKSWLTFVVVGAGPTGVELAGALAEIGKHTLAEDFRRIDPRDIRVILLEAHPRVLPPYPTRLSEKAKAQLAKLGVEVINESLVTEIDDEGVTFGGKRIATKTVLWAAGVAASPLSRSLGAELDPAGRVRVDADLSIPGYPNAFVIGDLAAITSDGAPVPGVAPAAVQEGMHVAQNIRRHLQGKTSLPFRYHDKGSLATIGRAAAVAHIGKLQFSGLWAWLAWLIIHIYFLIGFRNRILVLFNWAWSYVTYQRGARLITGEHHYRQLPKISSP